MRRETGVGNIRHEGRVREKGERGWKSVNKRTAAVLLLIVYSEPLSAGMQSLLLTQLLLMHGNTHLLLETTATVHQKRLHFYCYCVDALRSYGAGIWAGSGHQQRQGIACQDAGAFSAKTIR